MGYMSHHAIVVTSWQEDRVKAAREDVADMATEAFGFDDIVSPVVGSVINGYSSFFVAPDGSKEGWDHSEKGDDLRDRIVDYLNDRRNGYFDWAEINYGDDDRRNSLVRSDSDFNEEEE